MILSLKWNGEIAGPANKSVIGLPPLWRTKNSIGFQNRYLKRSYELSSALLVKPAIQIHYTTEGSKFIMTEQPTNPRSWASHHAQQVPFLCLALTGCILSDSWLTTRIRYWRCKERTLLEDSESSRLCKASNVSNVVKMYLSSMNFCSDVRMIQPFFGCKGHSN